MSLVESGRLEDEVSSTERTSRPEVRISAVVCTHNRARYLRKALESLARQALGAEPFEILVVDNASTDDTKQVVAEFAHLPNLRYIFEPIPGLSQARNTGWMNAKGEIVAYLDDDAVASPDWLAGYLEAFAVSGGGIGSVGGRCELIWESSRPSWLPDQLLTYFSVFHWADEPIRLNGDQWLSGCNLAYPRRTLESVGGFHTGLGRSGGSLAGGEENLVRWKLDSAGLDSVYDPRIVVSHHVPPDRLSKAWFRRVCYSQGASMAAVEMMARRPSMPRKAYMVLTKLVWILPRLVLSVLGRQDSSRFRRECQVRESLGYLLAILR